MNKDAAVSRLLAVARAEVGYLEKASNKDLDDKTANAGRNNYTKYARDLAALGVYNGNKNGYSWCDVFADWSFITAFGVEVGMKLLCQPMGGLGAGVGGSGGGSYGETYGHGGQGSSNSQIVVNPSANLAKAGTAGAVIILPQSYVKSAPD